MAVLLDAGLVLKWGSTMVSDSQQVREVKTGASLAVAEGVEVNTSGMVGHLSECFPSETAHCSLDCRHSAWVIGWDRSLPESGMKLVVDGQRNCGKGSLTEEPVLLGLVYSLVEAAHRSLPRLRWAYSHGFDGFRWTWMTEYPRTCSEVGGCSHCGR